MGDVTEATAGDVTEAAAVLRVPSQCRDGLSTLHSRELMARHYHVHWSCMIVGVAPTANTAEQSKNCLFLLYTTFAHNS